MGLASTVEQCPCQALLLRTYSTMVSVIALSNSPCTLLECVFEHCIGLHLIICLLAMMIFSSLKLLGRHSAFTCTPNYVGELT